MLLKQLVDDDAAQSGETVNGETDRESWCHEHPGDAAPLVMLEGVWPD